MKMFFVKLHRILGSILSLVFLVWFLSGFVMIYAKFPHADRENAFNKAEPLKKYANQIVLPTTQKLSELTLEVVNKTPVYSKRYNLQNASSLKKVTAFSAQQLDSLVLERYQSSIDHKVILTDYDAWIPWSSYKHYFPIHKYYLEDKTQVYVASTTGKVIQESTSKQRWLARFGAIPHWFYFKSLRLHTDFWADFIIWISALGCVMCLSGLVVGFYRSRKWRKLKKKGVLNFSPYKKKWYRWHHILGMTFGVFVFTFILSGMLSLMSIPQWIIPTDTTINYNKLWSEKPDKVSDFKLPLSKVFEKFENTKQITFSQIDSVPYYILYQTYQKPVFVPANNNEVSVKKFSYDDIINIASVKFAKSSYKAEKLTSSDNYFNPKDKAIVKLSFDDANKTWGYIDMENPTYLQVMTKSRRVSRWLYKGLHTFNFPQLAEMDYLRKALLIIVSLFGTIISLSGVVLGYRYFKRKTRK